MFVLASAFGNPPHSEIPHTTKYSSLVDAVQYMGCDYFKRLHHAENAKYKSHPYSIQLNYLQHQKKLCPVRFMLIH